MKMKKKKKKKKRKNMRKTEIYQNDTKFLFSKFEQSFCISIDTCTNIKPYTPGRVDLAELT